jgi:hypothetical protein
MNRRERNLIIVTVVVAAIALGFMVYDNMTASLATADVGSLSAEQTAFRRNSRIVANFKKIRQDYNSVALRNLPPTRSNMRPVNIFQNELEHILTVEFGFPSPRVETSRMSPIPQVEDYYFVDVDVRIPGEVADLVRLLEQMERRGLLIKEFTLEQRGYGRRQSAELKVRVSRLFQHDEISRKEMTRRNIFQ